MVTTTVFGILGAVYILGCLLHSALIITVVRFLIPPKERKNGPSIWPLILHSWKWPAVLLKTIFIYSPNSVRELKAKRDQMWAEHGYNPPDDETGHE